MIELQRAAEYTDRGTRAAFSVLIDLGQVLGAYRERFAVIGGMVPYLLFPDAKPQHIGSVDIDLALNPEALGGNEYVELVKAMESAGYQRGEDVETRAFQLARFVDLDDGGGPVKIIVDLLMPREATIKRNKPPILEEFAVLKGDGVAVALTHNRRLTLSGTMPDGRSNTVPLLVADVPALLVMKGYALNGRSKPKDAYDIWFSILNYEGGPYVLAEACRPLLEDPIALQGYKHIAQKFSAIDAFGPQTVRLFLEGSDNAAGLDRYQIERDAYGQVSTWYKALRL